MSSLFDLVTQNTQKSNQQGGGLLMLGLSTSVNNSSALLISFAEKFEGSPKILLLSIMISGYEQSTQSENFIWL